MSIKPQLGRKRFGLDMRQDKKPKEKKRSGAKEELERGEDMPKMEEEEDEEDEEEENSPEE